MLIIGNIRIENKYDFTVTDNTAPEVSFAMQSDIPDTYLTDAKIEIDGRVIECGNEQIGIALSGVDYKPFTSYSLTVSATDNYGNTAKKNASFMTGRLSTPWDAKWISDKSYKATKKSSPVPMIFKKSFTASGEIKRAFVTSTSIGIYELEINGAKVGYEYFAPGFTSYKNNLQYQYYDVTDMLKCENILTVTVAGGWAVGRFTYESKSRITADRQALLLELFVEYEDGTIEKIVTDKTWLVTEESGYSCADFYDGEGFDATYNTENSRFKPCDEIKLGFSPEIKASIGLPVVRKEKMMPVSFFVNTKGEIIYDFGQNFAGICELKINGKAGQKIEVRHAEVLYGDGLYTASLRTAKQRLAYTCAEGEQTYSPRFTYMGFRYIAISGINKDDIDVCAYALYSDFEECGCFECSNEKINRLQSNILWSGKSNFVDIPTDCPQRDERQGWTGDISVFASTACFNFDMGAFLEKWLRDMRSEQGRGGGIPMVIPRHGSTPPVVATACWGDSCIIVPYAEYLARGNKNLLVRQYPAMKKFMGAVKFWSSLSGFGDHKYIWKWLFQFGDWCAPDGYIKDWMARGKWIATAYYANSCALISKIAKILGKKDDEAHFLALRKRICDAYRNAFTDGYGNIKKEFQSAYVLPLHFEMETGKNRRAMAKNLDRLVKDNNYCIKTGFPATPYILFALADNGYRETAFKVLLKDECPSWLYEVKMGGTTFWKQWNAILPDGTVRDPSLNHYAYGAVGDFLYRRVLGIEPLEGGYRKYKFCPIIGGGITCAKGKITTPYGNIKASWKIENEVFYAEIDVPVSCKCEFVSPSGEQVTFLSGEHKFSEDYKE